MKIRLSGLSVDVELKCRLAFIIRLLCVGAATARDFEMKVAKCGR